MVPEQAFCVNEKEGACSPVYRTLNNSAGVLPLFLILRPHHADLQGLLSAPIGKLFYPSSTHSSMDIFPCAEYITPASKYFFSNLKNMNLPE
jgi:hypothetical protein